MQHEIIRRRQLPHWDVPDAVYFITACLEGSIPAQGLLDLQNYRAELERKEPPEGKTPEQWQTDKWQLQFARADHWLDGEPANRALADEATSKNWNASSFTSKPIR